MDLTKEFREASERVKSLKQRPTNDELLTLYALYKQATDGDVTGSRPGMLDIKGRAKFDAWAKRKGIPAETAMADYVGLVGRLVAK